jgi:hypothetical protein
MANSAYKHITGMDTVTGILQVLPREVRNDIMKTSLAAAARPIVRAAKRYARSSRQTGALMQSIDQKVINYRNTNTAVAIVGPRRDYYRAGKILGRKDNRAGASRPANYAHLVEFGHRARNSEQNTKLKTVIKTGAAERRRAAEAGELTSAGGVRRALTWVPAKPFIRPAAMTAAPQAAAAFVKGMEKGIERTRAKLIKRGTHAA